MCGRVTFLSGIVFHGPSLGAATGTLWSGCMSHWPFPCGDPHWLAAPLHRCPLSPSLQGLGWRQTSPSLVSSCVREARLRLRQWSFSNSPPLPAWSAPRAPAGTPPPWSRPGACARGLPEPLSHVHPSFGPPAQATGSSRCSVSGHDGDGCRASLGDLWRSRQLDTPGWREDPRVSAVQHTSGGPSLRAEVSMCVLEVARRWPHSRRKRREAGEKGVWKTVPWANQGRRLKGDRCQGRSWRGRSPARHPL